MIDDAGLHIDLVNAIHTYMVKINPGLELSRQIRGQATVPYSSRSVHCWVISGHVDYNKRSQKLLLRVKIQHDGVIKLEYGDTDVRVEEKEIEPDDMVPGWRLVSWRGCDTFTVDDPRSMEAIAAAMKSVEETELTYLMSKKARKNHVLKTNRSRSKNLLKRYKKDSKASE